jgi:hypothetical protein
MSKPNNIAQLMDMYPYQLKDIAKKSAIWFEEQAFLLLDYSKMSSKNALRGEPNALKAEIRPGSMYFFIYEAKHKDTLPYYDQFPMVLPFDTYEDGFIGLNLHYLPLEFRIKLLWKLQDFNTSSKLTQTTKIMFQWDTIKQVSKFRQAKPCVKRYLYTQLRSPFRIVDPRDWASAAMLPMERFTGSNKFRVWADSIRK